MVRSSQDPEPGQNLKNFTNRESEQALLRRLLELPEGQPLPIVMFYGVGGTGKSWLLRKLAQLLPQGMPSARLDLDPREGGGRYHGDRFSALAEIRRQLGDVDFPRFDLALAWARYKQGIADAPEFRGSGPAGNIGEFLVELGDAVAEDIPGQNLARWFLEKAGGPAWRKLKQSRAAERLMESVGQSDFVHLRRLSPEDIYAEFEDRFLADCRKHLPARAGCACRAVVFLDTFEALRGPVTGGAQGLEREGWVRELYRTDTPVLFVLGGRDRLRWEEADPDFADSRYLEQHLVGGLSEPDARLFLERCEIADPSLVDAILRASRDVETVEQDAVAYHAFSLGLCADTVANLRREGGPIDPASFDLSPGDTGKLAHRFLKSLHDHNQEQWVRTLALTPRFDEDAARAAYAHDAPAARATETDWRLFLGFSFVRPAGEPGWYSLHLRMRDALRDSTGADLGDRDDWWQCYWSQRSTAPVDRFAGLSWYHSYRADPNAALDCWNALAEGARAALRMRDHVALLNWPDAVSVDLLPQIDGRLLTDQGVELVEATAGLCSENLRRAVGCYEAALRVRTEADFPQDWAATQNNLGAAYAEPPSRDRAENLRRAIGCYEAALRVYDEADFPWAYALAVENRGIAGRRLFEIEPDPEHLKLAAADWRNAARAFRTAGVADRADRADARAAKVEERLSDSP